MKHLLSIALFLMLIQQASATIILNKWIDAWSNYASLNGWIALAFYQLLGWFAPILAGPLKVIAIDFWTQYVTKDTTGFMPMVFSFYGINSVQDVYLQLFQYLEATVLGFVGIKVDLSNNLISLFITGKLNTSTCASKPEDCGITCARYPSLKVGGSDCTTICGATPNNGICAV